MDASMYDKRVVERSQPLIGLAQPPRGEDAFVDRPQISSSGVSAAGRDASLITHGSSNPGSTNAHHHETIEAAGWVAQAVNRLVRGFVVVSKRKRPKRTVFGGVSYTTIYVLQRRTR